MCSVTLTFHYAQKVTEKFYKILDHRLQESKLDLF